METFTREEFRNRLLQAVERTRGLAERDLAEPLPPGTLLVLDAFSQGRKASSVEEVLAYLYKDGTFPRVVVVGLRGIVDGHTLVAILPSGHPYIDDRALPCPGINHPRWDHSTVSASCSAHQSGSGLDHSHARTWRILRRAGPSRERHEHKEVALQARFETTCGSPNMTFRVRNRRVPFLSSSEGLTLG